MRIVDKNALSRLDWKRAVLRSPVHTRRNFLIPLFVLALVFTGCDNGSTATPKAATPAASPAAGAVAEGQEITLTTGTSGVDIYYTTDDSTPTASSTKYSDSAKPKITADATLKAIAVKSGMDNSDVLSAAYTVDTSLPDASGISWVSEQDGREKLAKFGTPATRAEIIKTLFAWE